MFTHEIITDEHQNQIAAAINDALDRRKVAGVARDLAYDHIAQRVYRMPVARDGLEQGDLAINVEYPLLDGDARYGEASHAARQTVDRAASLLPGVPGDWLQSRSVPKSLVEAIKLLLDPKGPESEIRRRVRIIRDEQREQAARQHFETLEQNLRRAAEGREAVRLAAWHRLGREERAAIRAGGGDAPLTAGALLAETLDLAPPADWQAPPDRSEHGRDAINTTFRPSARQPEQAAYFVDHSGRRRAIGPGKVEVTSTTIGEMGAEAE